MSDYLFFIKKTFALAKKGLGFTNPNPLVGALIVKNDKIIASGYHKKFGFPHAEIEALNNAKTSVTNATLYVNLEPCTHWGKTPPCVDAIIKAGISKVICATLDPNPKVHGKGVTALRKAGIEVLVGVMEKEAREVNEAFFTFHEKKRPFIALKFAASLDGKIATKTGDSKWITSEKARSYARFIRSTYQAVLVGIQTIIHDHPHLDVRIRGKKDPLRIILDSHLQIPLDSLVLRDENVLLVTTLNGEPQKKKKLEKKGVKIIVLDNNQITIKKLLEELYKLEIISILVEGGGKILGSFADERLVDKVYVFYAPILIGGETAISAIRGSGVKKIAEAIKLKNLSFKKIDDDFLITGYTQ